MTLDHSFPEIQKSRPYGSPWTISVAQEKSVQALWYVVRPGAF